MKKEKRLIIDGHEITITHPGRFLFEKSKISKWQLVDYYRRIAPLMIPHIKDRPISMQRFPLGIGQEGFYQKDAPDYFPSWIKRVDVEKEDRTKIVSHVLCNNAATLVYMANQVVITPHVWLSRASRINYPDCIIFDLDPPSSNMFGAICDTANIIKDFVTELGLVPFVMTTGSRGLHVMIPIVRELVFDDVRAFARQIAQELADQYPKDLTTEVRKEKRKRRIFLDYLRNSWVQTAVAPYAVRAIEGAPVATPLYWKELTGTLHPQKYTIKNIFRRVAVTGDPWHDIEKHAGSVRAARKKLNL